MLRLLLQSSKMHGLHFLLLQKDSSRISADIFFDDKCIYIYNYCTQILFKANEETYIKYISQALVNNTKKAKEIGE